MKAIMALCGLSMSIVSLVFDHVEWMQWSYDSLLIANYVPLSFSRSWFLGGWLPLVSLRHLPRPLTHTHILALPEPNLFFSQHNQNTS